MKKSISFILFICCALASFSQAVFETSVSRTTASTADRIEVSFTLSNAAKVSNFKAPSLQNFRVLGGPYQSSNFANINGKTSRSISYKYVIQARKAGTFTIQPASIDVAGKTLKTQSVKLTISNKTVSDDQDDDSNDLTGFLRNNFYVRAEVSDGNIYKGESVTVTYNLYVNARSDIADYRVNGATKVPAFDGFYAEEIDVSHLQGEYQNINGTQFLVQPVKRVKLTAQRAGALLADALTIDATISIRTKRKGNDVFDDFFGRGYERYNYTATSPATKISVRDLPANAPASFNGAVGEFNMTSSISAIETSTDEPITYRINIKGKGNVTLFNPPSLELPPGWETYEPTVDGGKENRSYEYLLIPRNPGTFEIPAHQWSYFDPREKQYFILESDSYQITVEEGKNYDGTVQVPGKEDLEQLAKDIRFIKKDTPSIHRTGGLQVSSFLFIAGISTPFLAGVILLLVAASKRKNYDAIGERTRKAGAVARKRLEAAHDLASKEDVQGFCNEGIRVIWGYLADRFHIPHSELQKDRIEEVLQSKEVNQGLIDNTLSLLSEYEMALFAPSLSRGKVADQFKQLESWIIDMEKEVAA